MGFSAKIEIQEIIKMWTIKNDKLVLSVSEKGAEVHSLKKVNDH